MADRLLVLCHMAIWCHTIDDHPDFTCKPDTTPGSTQTSALRSQKGLTCLSGPRRRSQGGHPRWRSSHLTTAHEEATRRTVLGKPAARKGLAMSPHNNRSTSQASVSPDPDRPDTVLATFFPSRRICNRDEQNGPRTSDVIGTPGTFHTFYMGSSCQYWGRRRYGPAPQAFHLA